MTLPGKRSMRARRGRRQAGFTLIELMVVIAVIAVIAAIALPSLIESRKASNESSAIGSMRALIPAQELYRQKCPAVCFAGSLQNLEDAGVIDDVLGTGTKGGYRFKIFYADPYTWNAKAAPEVPGKTGDRWFYVDDSGVIRFTTGGPADAGDTPVGG